jgi:hypothetical protein
MRLSLAGGVIVVPVVLAIVMLQPDSPRLGLRSGLNPLERSSKMGPAMSMAQLWRDQGKCQQAHDLLASVYDWFTEGFDTLDLKEAKALLEQLKA